MGLLNRKTVVVSTAEKIESAVSDAGDALNAFEDAAVALELANDALDEVKSEVEGHIAGYQSAIALEQDKLAAIADHTAKNAKAAQKIREVFSL